MKNERIIKSTILKRKKTRKKNYKMKKTRKKNYKMKKTRKKIYKRKKTRKKLTFSGGDTSKIFELLDGKEDCNDIFRILENTLSSIQIRDIKKLIKKFNKYPIKKCNEKGMMREILYNKDFKYKILPEIIEILKGKVTTFNFIRHATSCNNSREGYYKMPLVKGGWDFDPALTYYGITKTIERAKELKYYEKTTTEYRNVYVSNMLRTIQTATILFGYNLRDKLNLYICPYIKEVDKEDIFISKAFKNGILIKKKLTIKKRRKEWLDSNWMYEYIKEKVTQYFIFTGNYDYKYMIIQRDSIDVCIDISKKLINEFITFITNKINNNESIDLFSNYNDETYSQITQFLEKLKNNGFFGSDEYDNFDAGREYYKNLYNIALLRVLEEIKEITADIGNMPQKIKIMISQYIEFLNYLCIGYNNNFNTEITLHALIHKEIDNTLIIKSVVKFIFVKKNNKTYSLKNKKDDYLTNILNLEKNYFELKRSYPDLYSKSGDLNKFIEWWLNNKNDIHEKEVEIPKKINIVTHSHVMRDYAKKNIEKIKSKGDRNKEIKIITKDNCSILNASFYLTNLKKKNIQNIKVINIRNGYPKKPNPDKKQNPDNKKEYQGSLLCKKSKEEEKILEEKIYKIFLENKADINIVTLDEPDYILRLFNTTHIHFNRYIIEFFNYIMRKRKFNIITCEITYPSYIECISLFEKDVDIKKMQNKNMKEQLKIFISELKSSQKRKYKWKSIDDFYEAYKDIHKYYDIAVKNAKLESFKIGLLDTEIMGKVEKQKIIKAKKNNNYINLKNAEKELEKINKRLSKIQSLIKTAEQKFYEAKEIFKTEFNIDKIAFIKKMKEQIKKMKEQKMSLK